MTAGNCANCGTRLDDDDDFCTSCGSSVRNANSTGAAGMVTRQPTLPPSATTNSLAIAAFVISLVACAPIGLYLGYKARWQIQETGEGGAGFALAAIVLGWIGIAFFAITVMFFVVIGSWAANS